MGWVGYKGVVPGLGKTGPVTRNWGWCWVGICRGEEGKSEQQVETQWSLRPRGQWWYFHVGCFPVGCSAEDILALLHASSGGLMLGLTLEAGYWVGAGTGSAEGRKYNLGSKQTPKGVLDYCGTPLWSARYG